MRISALTLGISQFLLRQQRHPLAAHKASDQANGRYRRTLELEHLLRCLNSGAYLLSCQGFC